jgi:hypothetical protein
LGGFLGKSMKIDIDERDAFAISYAIERLAIEEAETTPQSRRCSQFWPRMRRYSELCEKLGGANDLLDRVRKITNV